MEYKTLPVAKEWVQTIFFSVKEWLLPILYVPPSQKKNNDYNTVDNELRQLHEMIWTRLCPYHSKCLEKNGNPSKKSGYEKCIGKATCQKITSVLTSLTPVICTLINKRSIIWSYCPSLKYSFSVLLKRLENLTNSRFRCSKACFPVVPGMNPATSFTASSSFLIALAISLKRTKWVLKHINQQPQYMSKLKQQKTYLIVSRNVFRSIISSGILLKILFSADDFLFSSWNASSDLLKRCSTTEIIKKTAK